MLDSKPYQKSLEPILAKIELNNFIVLIVRMIMELGFKT